MEFRFSEADFTQIAPKIAKEIQVNSTVLITLKADCLSMLRRVESAAVVNISFALASELKASATVYCDTKTTVSSFSQTLRYQMEDDILNVKVFEVIPSIVDTQRS